MAKKTVFQYPGKNATVSWNGRLCIHVAECGRAKGDLFVGGRDPWCQPDLTTKEEVADVISRCPTGALTVNFVDGSSAEQPEPVNTVNVAYNGPLFIRGRLAIEDAPADAPGLAFRAALCRCGKSRNKPFCDNSHEKAGFSDYGAVGETGTREPGDGVGTVIVLRYVAAGNPRTNHFATAHTNKRASKAARLMEVGMSGLHAIADNAVICS
jgi:uncharacterized Fe-S cluster protein YjdI/CDGSH-type Zn-finger protein